jgi:DNA-binding GntR family transcriptional regulator
MLPGSASPNASGASGGERRRAGVRAARRGLADDVRDRIAEDFLVGEHALAPGAKLPGEVALSRRYDVSRVTLRAALRSLQEAGLIVIRHGSGATVLPRSGTVLSGLDRLSSIETFAREAGATVGTEDLMVETVGVDEALCRSLDLPLGAPVTVVRRVKTIGAERVAYMEAWVPESVCEPGRLAEAFRGSVLDVLLADPTIGLEYADCEIAPVVLDQDVARRLDVEPGVVALHMVELARTADGIPLEYGECWFLPEHFRFTLRRRRAFAP